MGLLVLAATTACYAAEAAGNPLLTQLGIDPTGGNMEGKEVRFGIALSGLFAVLTTGTSCGEVIAMHDSFTPLGGLVPMFLIQLGEVAPGGVGSGLYGILIFALLAVFVAGLMVGRTPEYLGKKIQAREIKLAMLAVLILPACILGGTAVSLVLPAATASLAYAVSAWIVGDAVHIYLRHGQQRQCLCGTFSGYAVAEHNFGHCNAAGTLRVPGARAGDCRFARSEAEGGGKRRHIPDAWAVVCRPARRCDPDPGGLAMSARFVPRPAGGTFRNARWPKLLRRHRCGYPERPLGHMDAIALFDRTILTRAARDSLIKLHPLRLIRNPVIFVTEVVAVVVTLLGLRAMVVGQPAGFAVAIAVWLWLTVIFATFAEAVAEGRGRARAESLRRARTDTMARRLLRPDDHALYDPVSAAELHVGDLVIVEAGDLIPSDGEIVEGMASVNESAVTGESAPVIREAGWDRSAVTGGTTVVSDWLVVRITAAAGAPSFWIA